MQTKFTLVLAALLCAALTTKAQVSKGNIVLGGNLGFSSSNQKDEAGNKNSSTNFSIAPSIGKVYKDNRVIGFIAKYRYTGNEISELNTNSFGAGVYLRQYKPLGKGFYVFAQESLNADFNTNKYIASSTPEYIYNKRKETSFYIAVNPGVAYDLSRKLQLELLFFNNLLSAGYSHVKGDYTSGSGTVYYSDYKEDNVYVNTNLDWSQLSSVNIGLKIFLNR